MAIPGAYYPADSRKLGSANCQAMLLFRFAMSSRIMCLFVHVPIETSCKQCFYWMLGWAAACMTWELAESGVDCVTSVVHEADLVPTFSAASADDLRAEVGLPLSFVVSCSGGFCCKWLSNLSVCFPRHFLGGFCCILRESTKGDRLFDDVQVVQIGEVRRAIPRRDALISSHCISSDLKAFFPTKLGGGTCV